jgi:hypothetical protein
MIFPKGRAAVNAKVRVPQSSGDFEKDAAPERDQQKWIPVLRKAIKLAQIA